MLHIKKRGNIYHVFWYERKQNENYDDNGNKKKIGKHRSKAISPLFEVAKTWAANKAAFLYAKKNNLPITNYPFLDFCDDYLEDVTSNKRDRTQIKDDLILRHFKRICSGVVLAEHFTDQALQNYITERKKEGVVPATINREIGMLKNMQRYGFENNYLPIDYAKKTEFLSIKTGHKKYVPSIEEIQYLFDTAEEPIITACILMLWHSMRPGEACNIELSDFNWQDLSIRVQDKPHLKWYVKNESSKRDIAINTDYNEESGLDIKGHLLKRYELAKKIGTKFICFYEEDGRQLTEGVLASMIVKLKKKPDSKLNKAFSAHKLRRAFITKGGDEGELLKAGIIAGHSSIKTTQGDYYAMTLSEEKKTMSKISFPVRFKSQKSK
jgi:integrase